MNFFEVLGLDPNKKYTPEEMKARYRELAKKYHPDKEGGDAEKFREIDHAYKMLSDPDYAHTNAPPQMSLDANIQVPLPFETAFFGGKIPIVYNRVELSLDSSTLVIKEVQDVVSFIVHIPPGSCVGYQYQESGAGIKQGERVGNLVVQFMALRHPRYQVDAQGNVATQENVPLEWFIKGGDLEVQTLYGLKTVKIPPGSNPQVPLIIPGCGARRIGIHRVIPVPVFPTVEELRTKKSFSDLDINWSEYERQEEARRQPQNQGYTIRFIGDGIFTTTGTQENNGG